jgi:hypothetical protein
MIWNSFDRIGKSGAAKNETRETNRATVAEKLALAHQSRGGVRGVENFTRWRKMDQN